MSCIQAGNAIICGSMGNPDTRRILHCPTCKRRRRMVMHYAGLWYGHDLMCLGCGDRWQDGEMGPRPFKRAWRKEAIARAKARWATAIPRAEYEAYCRADSDAYFEDAS